LVHKVFSGYIEFSHIVYQCKYLLTTVSCN